MIFGRKKVLILRKALRDWVMETLLEQCFGCEKEIIELEHG
jgi:hypothetical protein